MALAAIPVVLVGQHVVANAVGRTTQATDAGGTEHTVYWRDYPGLAGVDPQQRLEGPTPQAGFEAGQAMIVEIQAALSAEFGLEWAPPVGADASPFNRPIGNQFGGRSLLTNVNGPESQSTSVPQAWAGKQRAISIIGQVTSRYGANGLLAAEHRKEFEARLEPFRGLTPPEPLES